MEENLEVLIREARREELPQIQSLLESSGLPSEDIAQHWANFLVAVSQGGLAGVVGLEIRGTGALVRSLAVREERRGTGLGTALYDAIAGLAKKRGVNELGLLTTTAEQFFRRLGFRTTREVPPYVASSKEFTDFCPSTAVCMTKSL